MNRSKFDASKILLGAAISVCVLLSGCGTYGKVNRTSLDANWNPPPQPPKIIFGQKAYVWGERADVVRASGLFSSVETTQSRVPPKNGVLITNECNWGGEDRNFINGLVWMVTLGIIPTMATNSVVCTMNFYQNGTLLAEEHFSAVYSIYGGWIELFMDDEDQVFKRASQARFNVLLNGIK